LVIVSIIIPNFNGSRFIPRLFKSLIAQTYRSFEIIFVDNGSSDNSLPILNTILKDIPPEINVQIVKLNINTGYCKANNIGAARAKGKYLLFLNNDTFVSQSFLNELVSVLDAYPEVGACGSRIMFADSIALQTIGQTLDKYGWVDTLKDDTIVSGSRIDASFYPAFVAVIVRGNILSKCGSFDENLFVTGDYDLGWRIRLMGFSQAVALDSVCYHYGGWTVRMLPDLNRYFLTYKEKTYTLLKNFSLSRILTRFPFSVALMLASSSYKTFKLRKPYLPLLVYAFIWNVKNAKKLIIERTEVQNRRVVTDDEIETYMSDYPAILKRIHEIGDVSTQNL